MRMNVCDQEKRFKREVHPNAPRHRSYPFLDLDCLLPSSPKTMVSVSVLPQTHPPISDAETAVFL